MARTLASKRGFTLIELLMVVVIVGLIAVISFPSFRAIDQSARLHDDLNRIAYTLKASRVWAFTHKEPVEVKIDGSSVSSTWGATAKDTHEKVELNFSYSTNYTDNKLTINDRGNLETGSILLTSSTKNYSGTEDCIKVDDARVRFGVIDNGVCDEKIAFQK